MSALFSSYEQEVNSLITSLIARAGQGDERFGEDLREAEALVTQLEMEARSPGAGADVRLRVAKLRDELSVLRDRFILLGGGKKPLTANEMARASLYRDDEEALNRSANTLSDTRRTLMETESLASNINEDLLSHRATIQSSRDKLLHTGGLLGRAHRTMRVMQSRDMQRKLCVYAAVAFVVLMFVVFVVRELFPSSSKALPVDSPTSPPSYAPVPTPTLNL